MSKSRIKNLRNITVNGKQYKWLYAGLDCDGDGGIQLKIWNSNRVCILDEYIRGGNGRIVVTPKTIRERILNNE